MQTFYQPQADGGFVGAVAIDLDALGPDAFQPVLEGTLPAGPGSWFWMVQFGKYQCTDKDRRILANTAEWCDNDDRRPLYLGRDTAEDIQRLYKKLGHRVRVFKVFAGPDTQFCQARSRQELVFCEAWLRQIAQKWAQQQGPVQ